MAGPGDNTRSKSRGNGEADNFKRAVAVCMRAISGDHELEVAFAKDKPALAGNRARLPELPKKPSRNDIAVTRGLGDSMALQARLPRHAHPHQAGARGQAGARRLRRRRAGPRRGDRRPRHEGRRRQSRLHARGQVRQGQPRRRARQGRRADRGSRGADGAREADRPRRRPRAASASSICGATGSSRRPAPTSTACSTSSTTSRPSPASCATCWPPWRWPRNSATTSRTTRPRTTTTSRRARKTARRAARTIPAPTSRSRRMRKPRPTTSSPARWRPPTPPPTMFPTTTTPTPRRRARPGARQSASTNLPREIDYKVFTTAFDETVGAEELCDEEELDRLRAFLDKQLANLQGVVGRLANRLQRRLMAQQNRSWDFDLEEGYLDPARLVRIVIDPMQPLSFKQERDTKFRDTVVTLRARQFGLDARPADHGGGHLRRHSGAHAGALRRLGRDPRLHDARLEGRAGAREMAEGRQAGQPRPAQRSAPHHLQIGRRAVAAGAAQSRPDDARGPAQGKHRRRGAAVGAQPADRPARAAQDPDDDLGRRAGRRFDAVGQSGQLSRAASARRHRADRDALAGRAAGHRHRPRRDALLSPRRHHRRCRGTGRRHDRAARLAVRRGERARQPRAACGAPDEPNSGRDHFAPIACGAPLPDLSLAAAAAIAPAARRRPARDRSTSAHGRSPSFASAAARPASVRSNSSAGWR